MNTATITRPVLTEVELFELVQNVADAACANFAKSNHLNNWDFLVDHRGTQIWFYGNTARLTGEAIESAFDLIAEQGGAGLEYINPGTVEAITDVYPGAEMYAAIYSDRAFLVASDDSFKN